MADVAVMLRINSRDYFDRKYRFDYIKSWLTERNIPHTFMLLDSFEPAIPHLVLLPAEDATAFKLSFGL